MQLNEELSIGFVCIALFYTTCHHAQSTECTFPWLQSENLNILLIAWAVMCNTFNANMKNSNKTATKQDIGTIHRTKAWVGPTILLLYQTKKAINLASSVPSRHKGIGNLLVQSNNTPPTEIGNNRLILILPSTIISMEFQFSFT